VEHIQVEAESREHDAHESCARAPGLNPRRCAKFLADQRAAIEQALQNQQLAFDSRRQIGINASSSEQDRKHMTRTPVRD